MCGNLSSKTRGATWLEACPARNWSSMLRKVRTESGPSQRVMTNVSRVAPTGQDSDGNHQAAATHAQCAHGDEFAIGGQAAEGDEHADQNADGQSEAENRGKRGEK